MHDDSIMLHELERVIGILKNFIFPRTIGFLINQFFHPW